MNNYCGACGAPMVIHGKTYYRISDQANRGTCTNRLSIREDLARLRLCEAIRDRLASPAGIQYARKKLASAERLVLGVKT
jgi:hypothetical protein